MAVNLWIPLSTHSGFAGVDALIVSYLGRKEIDALGGGEEPRRDEETPYRCQAIVAAFQRFVQEDRACLDAGFPDMDVAVFRAAGYSLWRVPVLPIVDFFTCLTREDLQGLSVARYQTGAYLGYALHIQGHVSDLMRETVWGRGVRSLEGVVEMFKGTAPSWGISSSRGFISEIERVYDQMTGFSPLSEVPRELGIWRAAEQYPFITRILTGTDPILRLASEVPQIEQRLPEKPLKQNS